MWLPPGLHVSDERLGSALDAALIAQTDVRCLYGACHPDIDAKLAQCAGRRLPARNCIEAFLSPTERASWGERAFIISPGWLKAWRGIFVEGMGWDAIDARMNFGVYDVIVLLDFGLESIDDLAVLEVFDYTDTPVEIVPASLDHFRALLAQTMGG